MDNRLPPKGIKGTKVPRIRANCAPLNRNKKKETQHSANKKASSHRFNRQ